MESSNQDALSVLRDSLAEAQATVRSYDTKAQIVGIGYIFAFNIVGNLEERLPKSSEHDLVGILLAWGVVILPILLFGYVLYPSRKLAPKLDNESTAKLKQVLYVDPNKHIGVEDLKTAASRCDLLTEVAFELLKVSKLRELKRRRFLRALFAAGICFVFIFLSQVFRSL